MIEDTFHQRVSRGNFLKDAVGLGIGMIGLGAIRDVTMDDETSVGMIPIHKYLKQDLLCGKIYFRL